MLTWTSLITSVSTCKFVSVVLCYHTTNPLTTECVLLACSHGVHMHAHISGGNCMERQGYARATAGMSIEIQKCVTGTGTSTMRSLVTSFSTCE